MKIIDILNKIANGEEPPKKIVHNNFIYTYTDNGYYDEKADDYLFDAYYVNDVLNDEVEILETTITYNGVQRCTEATNKIEKIYHCYTGLTQSEVEIFITKNLNQMVDKINEIIEAINER